ncbi:MAG TPA: calcium-binding protein [Allosphingosinicella sp.]|nr:calcium-binding protein [Allosphingosinicella sp.]
MAIIDGTPDRDILTGTNDPDTINGGPGNDDIYGLGGADTLIGGDGNDLIDGGASGDSMDGGDGDDTYIVDHAGDEVVDSSGLDQVRTTRTSYALAAGIENLTGLSDLGQALTGNELANIIRTGAGADTIDGGGGDDTYHVGEGDSVSDTGGGTDHVITDALNYQLAAGLENLTGGNRDQTLRGNGLDNVINAGSGGSGWSKTMAGHGGDDVLVGGWASDRLDGGTGADDMRGGGGSDTYVVDDAGDIVFEAAFSFGVDEVLTSLDSYQLPDLVERITGTVDTGQVLTGNGLNNELKGGAGADTFLGGFGNDVYYVEANDLVIESTPDSDTPHDDGTSDEIRTVIQDYTLQQNVEILTSLDDTDKHWTGNFKLNVIRTGAGDDIIDGGTHGDRMYGGAGNDIYFVDEPYDGYIPQDDQYDRDYDQVFENANDGTDEVRTSIHWVLGPNLENLSARSGSAGLRLTGNFVDNVITGLGGDDKLAGEAGDDTLVGGNGDDELVGGSGADTLRAGGGEDLLIGSAGNDLLDGGGGIDTVTYKFATSAIVASLMIAGPQDTGDGVDTFRNIENLSGSSRDDVLRGNDDANKLSGGGGDDLLRGNGGNDLLLGGTGVDTVTYAGAASRVVVDLRQAASQNTGGAGTDTLSSIESATGSGFSDTLRGSDRANRLSGADGTDRLYGYQEADDLNGGAGNDSLAGGAGTDLLIGEAGADLFLFDDGDSSASRTRADRIEDFSRAEGDRINLRGIDADEATPGTDNRFSFIGTSAFSGDAGELRYQVIQGNTYVSGDTDGDAVADFYVRVDGTAPLQATDFVL